MIEKIQITDYAKNIHVEAYTDGYAYDEYDHVYLLSVTGLDSSVKAITAGVVSNRTIEIQTDTKNILLTSPWHYTNKIWSVRLGIGMLHQLVISELFFPKERGQMLIFVPEDEQPERVVFSAVKNRYSVPALNSWAGWLFETLKQEEALDRLRGNVTVFRLTTSEEQLDSLITDGIKSGAIGFVEEAS